MPDYSGQWWLPFDYSGNPTGSGTDLIKIARDVNGGVDNPTNNSKPEEVNPYEAWDANRWARELRSGINPKTGQPWTAGDLDEAYAKKQLSSEMRRAAEIIKDAWANTGYKYHGGMGNNAAWQQLMASNPELNAMDWAAWQQLMGEAWPAGYSPDQPVLSWNPGALPQQYRRGTENWFKQQGLIPTGSIGQYGYTQYQRPKGTPYKPISIEAFNAIPDEQLRQWMLYLGSLGGLISGSYQRPKV